MRSSVENYAVVIDSGYDAALLRDVCRKEALKYAGRAAGAVAAHSRTRNNERHVIFAKYAERFEHIRVEEAARVRASLGMSA